MQQYLRTLGHAYCCLLLIVVTQIACGGEPGDNPTGTSNLNTLDAPNKSRKLPTVTTQEILDLIDKIDIAQYAQKLDQKGVENGGIDSIKANIRVINSQLTSIARGTNPNEVDGLSDSESLTILEATIKYGYPLKIIQALLGREATITRETIDKAVEHQDNQVARYIIHQLEAKSGKISPNSFTKLLASSDTTIVKLVISKANVKHLDETLKNANKLPAVALVIENKSIDDKEKIGIVSTLFTEGAIQNWHSEQNINSYLQLWYRDGKGTGNQALLDLLLQQSETKLNEQDIQKVLGPILISIGKAQKRKSIAIAHGSGTAKKKEGNAASREKPTARARTNAPMRRSGDRGRSVTSPRSKRSAVGSRSKKNHRSRSPAATTQGSDLGKLISIAAKIIKKTDKETLMLLTIRPDNSIASPKVSPVEIVKRQVGTKLFSDTKEDGIYRPLLQAFNSVGISDAELGKPERREKGNGGSNKKRVKPKRGKKKIGKQKKTGKQKNK